MTVEGATILRQELINAHSNVNAERPKKKETKQDIRERSEVHAVAVGNLAVNPACLHRGGARSVPSTWWYLQSSC